MKNLTMLVMVLMAALLSFSSQAASVDTYQFDDEVTQKRFHSLSQELRCPKCQNQNLADSNSPIARDLRKQVYELLMQDQSDQQIIDYMVARYGDYVLYKPRFDPVTYLLWLGPAGFGLLGFLILIVVFFNQRRKKSSTDEATEKALSKEQQAKLDKILNSKDQ